MTVSVSGFRVSAPSRHIRTRPLTGLLVHSRRRSHSVVQWGGKSVLSLFLFVLLRLPLPIASLSLCLCLSLPAEDGCRVLEEDGGLCLVEEGRR